MTLLRRIFSSFFISFISLSIFFLFGSANAGYSPNAAYNYANKYWDEVVSDGYFWTSTGSPTYYGSGSPVPTATGYDCAHFLSGVIGTEPHETGGGLNIPSRTVTYGEPSANSLSNLIINDGYGTEVSSVTNLSMGDVIFYDWTGNGSYDHSALYLGNNYVAAHSNSHWNAYWTLGGAVNYRFIHMLSSATGYASVSALSISPTAVVLGQNFTVSFTLKEINGASKTFEQVAVAILRSDGSLVFDFAMYNNVTVPANGTWSQSPSNSLYISNPPGTYKVMIRGKVGGNWFDFDTTGNGVNPKSFTAIAPDTTPPTVITNAASNTAQTSATLNGTIANNGSSSIDERRFDWGLTSSCADGWVTDNPASSHYGYLTITGNSFSYNLTGLQSNTTYYFRSWAHNSAGWGNGTPIAFITNPTGGVLSVTPSTGLTSSGAQGGPFSPSSSSYTLQNTGGSSINWTASNGSWYTVSPTSGSLTAGASTTLTVSINSTANSLSAGSYQGTISFTNTTNNNGNTTRTVNLTVNATAGSLSVTPTSNFSSSGTQGGPFSPSSTSYTLQNTGGASINWTASNGSWYTVSPTSGSLAAGASTTVTVSINSTANSLSAGSYQGTISFTNTTNNNGNTTRTANLTVNATAGSLSVTPTTNFSSSGTQGGPFSPSSTSYTLQNTGGISINWTASKGQNWVTLSSTGGTLAAGASTTVTASINSNANSLTSSSYSDTISFTNTTTGIGNQARSVSLTVNASWTAPTATTGSATSIGQTTATLNGTVNPNGSSTTAYFQWGSTTSYGAQTEPQSIGSGTSAVAIPGGGVSGLTCNTTYHYRAIAYNSQGTNGGISYGSDASFTTSACSQGACSSNAECGITGWVGSAICISGDVYERYRISTCNNPGAALAFCSSSEGPEMKQDCDTGTCSGGQCINAPAPSPVYRFWGTSSHFYTISEADKAYVMATWPDIWHYEGIAFYAYPTQVSGTLPVYRFWGTSSHFYTISEADKAYVMATWPDIWHYEGIAFYAYPTQVSGTLPVYRFWGTSSHFYTISEADKAYVMVTWPDIWHYEGIAFYAYSSEMSITNADLQKAKMPFNSKNSPGVAQGGQTSTEKPSDSGFAISLSEEPLTREELAVLLMEALEGDLEETYCDTGSPYSDVERDRWSCRNIKRFHEYGYNIDDIKSSGSEPMFYPEQSVTREQLAVLLAKILNTAPVGNHCNNGSQYIDVAPDRWSCQYIENMSQYGVDIGCQTDDPKTLQNESMFCSEESVRWDEIDSLLSKIFERDDILKSCRSKTEEAADGTCRLVERLYKLWLDMK